MIGHCERAQVCAQLEALPARHTGRARLPRERALGFGDSSLISMAAEADQIGATPPGFAEILHVAAGDGHAPT